MLLARKFLKTTSLLKAKRLYSVKNVPSSAEIVIAGGGIIGTSIAYHLAELGWKDIVILEQGSPGCGTSWHAAGLVGSLKSTKVELQNVLYAQKLFEKFEQDHGVGFKKCGSLSLAQTDERAKALKRMETMINSFGGECHLISPEEAGKLNPYINIDDIKLAFFVPNDGVVNPTDVVNAYLKGAMNNGSTKLLEGVQVQKIKCDGRRVTNIETDHGNIKCDYFINSAGLWARELGQKSDIQVQVPLHACEHFYIVTKPCNVDTMMPVTRDYDSFAYMREWSGGLMAGGFEPNPLPCFHDKIPEKFEFQLLDENWDQFMPLMEGISNRFPLMKTAEIRTFLNGPESFTPDYRPYFSRSMELENYYIAAGMTSYGIAFSAGVGRTLAELITHGEASNFDFYTSDIRRIAPGTNNKRICRTGARDTLENAYLLQYPDKCHLSSRNILTSSIHNLLTKQGAVWTKENAWEIPTFFKEANQDEFPGSFGRPLWLQNVQNEIKTAKTTMGIVDLSSQSVFQLTDIGNNSMAHLMNVILPGKFTGEWKNGQTSISTPIVNQNGRCVAMVTINKSSNNSILISTDAFNHNTLYTFLQGLLNSDKQSNQIILQDMTSAYSCFGLVGPNTMELLKDLIPPPDNEDIETLKGCKLIDIGYASNVIIYPGQLGEGFNLLIPTNQCQGLYQEIMDENEKYGIRNIGHYAWNSLRVQKRILKVPNEIGMNTSVDLVEQFSFEKELSNIKLMKIKISSDEIWPMNGDEVLHQSTQTVIGHITSIGYNEDDHNEIFALASFSSGFEDGNTEKAFIRTGAGNFDAKVIS
eukprot:TCONS_00072897-protein